MQNQGYSAYASAQRSAVGLKELERMAMARSTSMLQAAQKDFTVGSAGYAPYANAIKFNQKLWTLIQANIADNPGMGTKDVRHNLLRVSFFVDQQTFVALQNPNPEHITPLIEVNKTISSGLYQNPPSIKAEKQVDDLAQRFMPSL